MKARWVSVVGHLIGQVLGECLGLLSMSALIIMSERMCVCVCIHACGCVRACVWVYSLLCFSVQIAVSCLIVRVIMKYCLIYWVLEFCVILMNRTFYFFIRFIVWWLGVALLTPFVCVCLWVGVYRCVCVREYNHMNTTVKPSRNSDEILSS